MHDNCQGNKRPRLYKVVPMKYPYMFLRQKLCNTFRGVKCYLNFLLNFATQQSEARGSRGHRDHFSLKINLQFDSLRANFADYHNKFSIVGGEAD